MNVASTPTPLCRRGLRYLCYATRYNLSQRLQRGVLIRYCVFDIFLRNMFPLLLISVKQIASNFHRSLFLSTVRQQTFGVLWDLSRAAESESVGVSNFGRSQSRWNFVDSDYGSDVLVTAWVTHLTCPFLLAPTPTVRFFSIFTPCPHPPSNKLFSDIASFVFLNLLKKIIGVTILLYTFLYTPFTTRPVQGLRTNNSEWAGFILPNTISSYVPLHTSGGSRIWPKEGPTCQRGLPGPGGPLQLWWVPWRFEGQRGPFEASGAHRVHYELRRPLRTAQRASSDAQRAPYELRGSLRRSVNLFRGHQSTCCSLQTKSKIKQ